MGSATHTTGGPIAALARAAARASPGRIRRRPVGDQILMGAMNVSSQKGMSLSLWTFVARREPVPLGCSAVVIRAAASQRLHTFYARGSRIPTVVRSYRPAASCCHVLSPGLADASTGSAAKMALRLRGRAKPGMQLLARAGLLAGQPRHRAVPLPRNRGTLVASHPGRYVFVMADAAQACARTMWTLQGSTRWRRPWFARLGRREGWRAKPQRRGFLARL